MPSRTAPQQERNAGPCSLPAFQPTGWGHGEGKHARPCGHAPLPRQVPQGSSVLFLKNPVRSLCTGAPVAGFRSSCTAPTASWLLLSHLAFQTTGVAPIHGVVTGITGRGSWASRLGPSPLRPTYKACSLRPLYLSLHSVPVSSSDKGETRKSSCEYVMHMSPLSLCTNPSAHYKCAATS